MLTTIPNYHDFLVYYYNLACEHNLIEAQNAYSAEYIKLDHNLKVFPQFYQQGNYLVPDHLVPSFLIWWKEKSKNEMKEVLH